MSASYRYNSLSNHEVYLNIGDDEKDFASRQSSVLTGFITVLVYLSLAITLPVSLWFCLKVVKDYERAVVFRAGKLLPLRGPGIILVIPCFDDWTKVDLRTKAFNVPPQNVITTEGAALMIGANVQFKVFDPILMRRSVQDLNHALRLLAQTMLVNMLVPKTLAEIQQDRKFINLHMQESLNKVTRSWGVYVEKLEISEARVLKDANGTASIPASGQNPLGGLDAALHGISGILQGLNINIPMARPREAQIEEITNAITNSTSTTSSTSTGLLSPSELVTLVAGTLTESIVSEVDAIYKFVVTGEGGGVWMLDLKNGSGCIRSGESTSHKVDATLTMSVSSMHKLFYGEITPFNAYMNGDLSVDGDVKVAMRLETVINKLKERPVVTV